ncbi:hypothetical protein RFI_00371 [Reticulomyxa filosa]|uniref:UBC core domain-containing protein n=1 Tax=Reticulomyxa filosa TaxID=46433 RepID=X6PF09_RETFI|nr:hypothetical protein RFI_00371 [Reticulomyxa filosa]|eukprot:ETO36693.1 hypothetical protein RFI_00371 [Reticulomyxa filosa]
MGRGNRAKKKEEKEANGKKKAPGLLRVQVDLDELELPYNAKLQVPDKENLQEFNVAITPDSGFWKGATYTFHFVIPDNYPYKPPKVTCVEKVNFKKNLFFYKKKGCYHYYAFLFCHFYFLILSKMNWALFGGSGWSAQYTHCCKCKKNLCVHNKFFMKCLLELVESGLASNFVRTTNHPWFNLFEPNPADPLNVEAAEVFRDNITTFKANVAKSLAGGYVGGTQFEKMTLK